MINLVEIIAQEMRLRNYSPKTRIAYTRVVRDFYHFIGKPLRNISENEIKKYLLHLDTMGRSSQTISLVANALNFLYTQIYPPSLENPAVLPRG